MICESSLRATLFVCLEVFFGYICSESYRKFELLRRILWLENLKRPVSLAAA